MAIQFGGYAFSEQYAEAAQVLYDMATADGYNLVEESHYDVGYDGPYTIFERRNEIWFKLAEE